MIFRVAQYAITLLQKIKEACYLFVQISINIRIFTYIRSSRPDIGMLTCLGIKCENSLLVKSRHLKIEKFVY